MPAPVQVREQDDEIFANKFFVTAERDHVPLSTTDYIGLDQGNCNPRYMRTTLDYIPWSKELADMAKVPMGIVVQPLAKHRKGEIDIQVVHHGEDGPIRCTRCRAYINPWCIFSRGGYGYECNICTHYNEVPAWYVANIDMDGRRVDLDERPELKYGSVEFEVPADYHSSRAPVPMRYVFAFDVSVLSIQSNILQAACEALKRALYDEQGHSKLINKIAIVTFDKDLQFYNLSPSLVNAQMLVVSDVDDVFIPLQGGIFADPTESKNVICQLLDSLPQMFKDTMRAESVYTAAVKGGLQALKSTGGHVFVFQSCLPNYGPDALKSRDERTIYGTDKEKNLLVPQSKCIKNGVCVNTWVFPYQYMDLATISGIPQLTGGEIRYFPGFQYDLDKCHVQYQLHHDIHRHTGFDGILRIRASNGLQVTDHYGNCYMGTYTDVDLSGIDEDKSIAAVLKHDGKIDTKQGASFQCAMLYTTRDGHRRVRVHNLQLLATSQVTEVFRYGDIDTTMTLITRQIITDIHQKTRKVLQDKLMDLCIDVLANYRINCAASTSPGQLILPEAFKLLPVYVHSMIRSIMLLGVGNDVRIDSRVAGMSLLNSMTISETVWTLYPRMYAIHNLKGGEGLPDLRNEIRLPPMVRLSYERLDSRGAYLLDGIDTGSDIYIWLGQQIHIDYLMAVFNVPTLDEVNPKMVTLPTLSTDLSNRIHNMMHTLQSQRSRYLTFHLVRQEIDPEEYQFATWMCEDKNSEIQSYVDYMCVLHRKIQEEIRNRST
ncbi:Sec23/Sec24 trunk domain-containing protein [Pilobolus umbonatus]|nr:Sec23/Sec24 trunk domain-containing protein [Pilobolus umbonatus]